MPSKKQTDAERDQERQRLEAKISQGVLVLLGTPPALVRVQVRRVLPDTVRVNVYVSGGGDSENMVVREARIAHSYYATVDSDGEIVTSTPKIKKCY